MKIFEKFLFLCAVIMILSGCISDKAPKTYQSFGEVSGLFNYVNQSLDDYLKVINSNAEFSNTPFAISMKKNLSSAKLLLLSSGIGEIYSVEKNSRKLNSASASPVYLNTEKISYNSNATPAGFLNKLFKKANRNLHEDVAIITDSTIFAADFDLTPSECIKALPKLPQFEIWDNFAKDNFSMSLAELSELTDGEWGIIINCRLENPNDKKSKLKLDFMIAVPDVSGKLFPLLINYVQSNTLGIFKDDIIRLEPVNSLIIPVIVKQDNHVLIYSGENAITEIVNAVKPNQYNEKIKNLQLPEVVHGNGFVYCDKQFTALLCDVFKREFGIAALPESFFNFESFTVLNYDTPETPTLFQYANFDFNQLDFLEKSAWILIQLNNKMIMEAQKKSITLYNLQTLENCRTALRELYKQLTDYAASHDGKFPAADNQAGFQELAKWRNAPELDFKRESIEFYYLGDLTTKSPENFPLVFDRGGNHGDRINVLFVNGEIKSFKLENPNSAKKIISFLHTIYKYNSNDFADLIKHAAKM